MTFAYETQDGTATAASKDYKAEGGVLTFEPGPDHSHDQPQRSCPTPRTRATSSSIVEPHLRRWRQPARRRAGRRSRSSMTTTRRRPATSCRWAMRRCTRATPTSARSTCPVTINKKRPQGAIDEDVEVQLDIAYGSAVGHRRVRQEPCRPIVLPGRCEQERPDQGARRHRDRT